MPPPAWALLALGAACCATAGDLLLRRLLRQGLSSRLAMGASCCLTALLALPLLPWNGPRPDPATLLAALAATALINGLAFWSYGRALARGELSLVLPLINLSPLVLLASGFVVLGERPGPLSIAGVVLVVAGACLLGRGGPSRHGLLAAPGAREMLLTAVLWGIGASIDKLGVRAGGSLVWVAGLHLVVGLPLLLAALLAGDPARAGWGDTPDQRRGSQVAGACTARLLPLLLVGLLGLLGGTMQMLALQSTAVVHVVAIKRLSTLFGSIIGVLWLGDCGGSLRLPAAGLMFAGALLVLQAAGP